LPPFADKGGAKAAAQTALFKRNARKAVLDKYAFAKLAFLNLQKS